MRHRILIMVSIAVLCSGFVFGQTFQLGEQSSIRGQLTDNSNAGVGRATVILSQPGGQTVGITTAGPAGEYAFRNMAPGDYAIQAFAVGFGPSRLINVTLPRGGSVTQNISMDIRFVSAINTPGPNTAVIRGGTVNTQNAPLRTDGRMRVDADAASQNLLQTVSPVMPPLAAQARISGIVIVEVAISIDGAIKEARIVSGHPLLQQAAIDAVGNYRFKPFLLNGAPTEALTTISVPFRANQ